jgi:glycosyltransferase involved in cell wall biosynthesis
MWRFPDESFMRRANPLVSICIPTCNGEAFVAETLASALAQTAGDVEIIVCDDASTDGSVAIACSSGDPRVRVEAHRNRLGIPGNWMRAMARAQGERVLLLMHDDVLRDDAIAELSSALDRVPQASLAFGRRQILREGNSEHTTFVLGGDYPALQDEFYSLIDGPLGGVALVQSALRAGRELTINVVGEPSFVLMRAQAFADVGGFNGRLRQLVDWELWLRLADWGPLCFVDRVVGSFRVHADSQSARSQGTPRVPWEYVQVLGVIEQHYGSRLSAREMRLLKRARWQYRRHVLGEAVRFCLRRSGLSLPSRSRRTSAERS